VISSTAEAILIQGLDDWVPLLTVEGTVEAMSPGVTGQSLVDRVTSVIRELLEGGFVLVGDVQPGKRPQGGFHAWTTTSEDALTSIGHVLANTDQREWEFRCWLCNTALGDEVARAAMGDD